MKDHWYPDDDSRGRTFSFRLAKSPDCPMCRNKLVLIQLFVLLIKGHMGKHG